MRITYHPIFTNNFKFNSYTLNFLMPLTEENATYCALLAQVLKRGCRKYGEMDQIVGVLESLYGASVTISSDKVGENLSFTVQCYCMDDRFAVEGEEVLGPVLDVLAQLLMHPMTEKGVFRADFVEQEKINHADLIRSMINDKRVYSMIRCKEIMFADSTYRFTGSGTLSCLQTITPESLFEFYQNLLQNSSLLISYIGRKIDLCSYTQHYFPELCQGKDLPVVVSDFVNVKGAKCVEESYDVAQGKLCMGYRFEKDTDYFATRLFNVIYGGSPTSKLFSHVREELSLCYYCSSAIDPFVHSMFISSGIEFDKYEVAKKEIMAQLDDMKQGKISDEEFENGKIYLMDYILGMQDLHGALLSDALRNHMLHITEDIQGQINRIQNLRKEDIISVANCLQLDTVYFLKGNGE